MKKISVFLLMALMLMPMVLADLVGEIPLDAEQQTACISIKNTINTVIKLFTVVAGSVAVIAAIVVGIMFMNASDPSDKDRLGARLKSLIVGTVIVVVAGPLASFLFGSLMKCVP